MPETTSPAEVLLGRFLDVRRTTEALAAPLTGEDQQLQSMPDCSPTKWHRAHTTWFFETFVLAPHGVAPHDPRFAYLFNSYYETVGPRHARPRRGMVSRPTAEEIGHYRRAVDAKIEDLLGSLSPERVEEIRPVLELGLHHEQQHQELILTDILHAFHENPTRPAYRADLEIVRQPTSGRPSPLRWIPHSGGLVDVGAADDGAFVFDNERPRHRAWLEPFEIASRLVTVAEVKAFVREGGYKTPSLWLSDGIDWVRSTGVEAPGYARMEGDRYVVFGLTGEREAEDDEPATHVGFYEADAIARFLDARLPSEEEWEAVAAGLAPDGNFLDDGALAALPAREDAPADAPAQMFGDAWEWTRSDYGPYPGYRPDAGALGEYNGKFMVNQRVLRGGSAFTPRGHIRATYRNFWVPATRFQLTGIRLAR